MRKKAMTSAAMSLIIAMVVILFLIYFGTQIYQYSLNQGIIGVCSAGILTANTVDSLKNTGVSRTYEVNCKAQQITLVQNALLGQTITKDMASRSNYGDIAFTTSDQSIRGDVLLQDYFAKQLQSCWQITGNRKIVDIRYTPAMPGSSWINTHVSILRDYTESLTGFYPDYNVVVGIDNGAPIQDLRKTTKTNNLKKYLNYDVRDIKTTYWESAFKENKPFYNSDKSFLMPAVMCMVCSTTHFDTALETTVPQTVKLNSYLDKKPFKSGGDATLGDVLSGSKLQGYPLQEFSTHDDQSVIYYQLYESPEQEQALSRTGVLVMPTKDVSSFCDVILNRG